MEKVEYEKIPGFLKAIFLVELIKITEKYRVLDLSLKKKELSL
jgi:hypothetical protein